MDKFNRVQHLLTFAFLISSTVFSTKEQRLNSVETVNMTALLSDYVLTCGSSEGLCRPQETPFNINITVIPNCAHLYLKYFGPFGIPRLGIAKSINCDIDCALAGTCAPDAEHAFDKVACVTTDIFPIGRESNMYKMITGCGVGSVRSSARVRLCESLTQISSSNYYDLFRPVISAASNLTYRNRYCAACNDETNFISFDLSIFCAESTVDINLFSSVEDLWRMFQLYSCSVSYKPPVSLQDHVYSCNNNQNMISQCNETGLWLEYDSQIEWACENFNSLNYKNYKNIFCYMCNPSLLSVAETELIDTCNITGRQIYPNLDVEEACHSFLSTPRTFPFKNRFCEICNGIYNETDQPIRRYKLFTASLSETAGELSEDGPYTLFRDVKFHSALDKGNKTAPHQSDFQSSTAEVRSVLEELGRFCGFEEFCDQPFPYLYVWAMFPMCLFPCAYGKNCCEVLSLGLNTDILMPANLTFNAGELQKVPNQLTSRSTESSSINSNDTTNYIPVIGHCPSANQTNDFKDKCENELMSDILSYIPVTSDFNLVDYKSVYCARCNKDYGTLSSHGFSVFCHSPLEATKALQFEIISSVLEERKCEIKVHTPRNKCRSNPNCVRTCNKSSTVGNYSALLINLCETGYSSFSQFPPVEYNWTLYKNVFCVMCNIGRTSELGPDIISECNVTGKWDNTYEPYLEEICANTAGYPGWYPFKNIFCALCNMPLASVSDFFRDIDEEEYIQPICGNNGTDCACTDGCEAVFGSSFRAMFARSRGHNTDSVTLRKHAY